ncbi:PASTA domain-containing protein [Nocardioides sp. AE5]|uniref:PASTA domain-containing protein n=1 Tax=Nocardioides sp. AE5 TaxID=2962573 RepID=UPI002881C615|nr:PASTA domain-containing protein [Nocardioides sp. AE5]MDT0200958.1 PASTA domain-containing protein [Nocardioides sp. AE5]
MSEEKLEQLLAQSADRVPVGEPPLAAMLADARRSTRRRRLGVALGSAAAVVAVTLGASVLPGLVSGHDPEPSVPDPTGAASGTDESLPGPGMRLVGIADVVVEVPEEWGTNETHCGTPMADTVVVDEGVIGLCAVLRQPEVTSVHLSAGRAPVEFHPDVDAEVDGVAVRRESTSCGDAFHGVLTCASTLYFPQREVYVRAESSSESEPEARREVEEALARVHVLADRVAVPGWRSLTFDEQGDGADAYLALLADLGLEAEVVEESHPGMPPGFVLGASPDSGTVVEPGSTVTVTVVAPQDRLAERMSAGVSTDTPEEPDSMREVTDAELRAGADLTVAVGDTVWVTWNVEHKTLRVTSEVTGEDVLRTEEWTWDKWTASAPGQATITLYVEDGTERERLGEVRVTVQ